MLKTQFGESATADLEEGTWTFEIRDELKVSAGVFAIIPEQKYQNLLIALRGIRNLMNAHPDSEENSEFEDMVSRCDEILESL